MSVRCIFLGAPENLGSLGRAEALVARRFNRGPQRASLEWGEEERWSALFRQPKSFSEVRDDEGYRLCDSSAECDCKITAFF